MRAKLSTIPAEIFVPALRVTFHTEFTPPTRDVNGPEVRKAGAKVNERFGSCESAVTRDSSLHKVRLLIMADDVMSRDTCCKVASRMGFDSHWATCLAEARTTLQESPIDIILFDLDVLRGDGLSLLEEVKVTHPKIAVVVMSEFLSVASVIEATHAGAADCVSKPLVAKELAKVLDRISHCLLYNLDSREQHSRPRIQDGLVNLVGQSPKMEEIYRVLSNVAFQCHHPVLITGESGTGKELVAKAIHINGPNAAMPFVTVNCNSLVPELIDRDLFGDEGGISSGRHHSLKGVLTATEGTVFLDEIDSLPLELQAKLAQALRTKEVRPTGATRGVPISARVLAASSCDLGQMLAHGRFRRDLYLQLNIVNLKLPPLRERRDDVAALALHFLAKLDRETGESRTISRDAVHLMTEYDWPGNVRELEFAIEHACSHTYGCTLQATDLPFELQDFRIRVNDESFSDVTVAQLPSTVERRAEVVPIAEMERRAILETIAQLKGDKLGAARLLGIGKTTLYRKLKEYDYAADKKTVNPNGRLNLEDEVQLMHSAA